MLEQVQQLFQQKKWLDLYALVSPLCESSESAPLWALQYGGTAAFYLGEMDKAESWLLMAYEARPQEGWTAFFLGRLELQRGRWSRAIDLLEVSSHALSDQPWPRFFLVEACLTEGDWLRALYPLRCLLPDESSLPGLNRLRKQWMALATRAGAEVPPLGVLSWSLRLSADQWLLLGWSTAPALAMHLAVGAISPLGSQLLPTDQSLIPRFAGAEGQGLVWLWQGDPPPKGWSIDDVPQRPQQLDLDAMPWPASANKLLNCVHQLGIRDRDLECSFQAWLGPSLQILAPSDGHAPCVAPGSQCLQVGGSRPDKPQISVIIPLYRRWDFLRAHLMHLAAEPLARQGLLELVVVLDDPALESDLVNWCATHAEAFGIPFRLLLHQANFGFAQACNSGAVEAHGRWLVLLNSDVFPRTLSWLERLQAELEQHKGTALVAPLLLYPDGSLQHGGMTAMSHPRWPGLMLNSHPGKGLAWHGGEDSFEQPLLSAAVWMLDRERFLALGGLRRDLIQGDFEDSAFCHRLAREGLSARLVPEVVMVHAERQSLLGRQDSVDSQRQLTVLANAWLSTQSVPC